MDFLKGSALIRRFLKWEGAREVPLDFMVEWIRRPAGSGPAAKNSDEFLGEFPGLFLGFALGSFP